MGIEQPMNTVKKTIYPRGIEHDLISCHCCTLVMRHSATGQFSCPRCHTALTQRKPNSIQYCWAYTLTAIIMYIPANLLPIMTVSYLGDTKSDTIMSGVIYLASHGMWPLALVIFIASVFIPLLKIGALVLLMVSVQKKSLLYKLQRTKLYRMTELVGKWSMVDVFVVALLVALVQFGEIASIQPGVGALAFSVVVIMTMLAAESFDARLIWDAKQ
jgi:paraquat-inducible protein A